MSAFSRRDLCAASFGFTSLKSTTTSQSKPTPESVSHNQSRLSQSEVFSLEKILPTPTANGGKRWDILHGVLATGETIAIHESLQPAGAPPNPAHTIQHSEFIFLQQGTLLFQHDGKSERVDAGGVIFITFGTEHAVRNVGAGPAQYLVIAIGGDTQ